MTLHDQTQLLARIYTRDPQIKPSCPEWIRRKIAVSMHHTALRRAAKEAVKQHADIDCSGLSRDYRGWNRATGAHEGPGSGRAADWLDVGFEHLGVAAQTIHRELGFRDEVCRSIARTLHSRADGWGQCSRDTEQLAALPECPINPQYWDRGYQEDFARDMARHSADPLEHAPDAPESVQRWRLYCEWHIGRALAEHDRAKRLQRIAADPAYRISGYLADSILSWRIGKKGYEGCSGSGSYACHREHPEEWDLLLSRAPMGAKTEDAEQVFPHEHTRAAALRAAGWHETLRMSDSIFTRKSPFATVDTRMGRQ